MNRTVRERVRKAKFSWEEAEQLAEVSKELANTFDRDAVVDTICRRARRLAAADGACVIFREGEMVHYSRVDSVAPLWAGCRFPIGNCLSGWSIVHRQPVVIPDIRKDPRVPLEYYEKTFVKSLAITPIDPRSPIGAIGVYWAHRHRATLRQMVLLERLADIATTALINVDLFDKINQARKEAEEKAEELRKAAKLKDEFLANVSHELRTPLNTILGWAQMLTSGKLRDPERERGIEAILMSARNESQVVDQLLVVSRIDSGKFYLKMEPTTLEPLLAAVLQMIKPVADEKMIQIVVERADENSTIIVDPTRIQQVLWNLVNNAVKFTPRGGQVTVRTGRLGASELQITVSDTGQGISPDFLPFVFERFRQADGSTTRNTGGLGLGLTIAKHLVELHGGTIRAESRGEGQGATFRVHIPCGSSSQAQRAAAAV